jgi:hypothetical protein
LRSVLLLQLKQHETCHKLAVDSAADDVALLLLIMLREKALEL